MKKILVPIDYSSHSDNAVKFALAIATKIDAEIHLFHGLEVPELIAIPGMMVWPSEDFSELQEDADQDIKRYKDQLIDSLGVNSPTITFSTRFGSIKPLIDEKIESYKPNLVVMGMEGKSKLNRFFLGSTSKAMIDKAKVPILLVPTGASYKPIDKIAFATDLSESDLNSINNIARLFCFYNTEILLVHVNEDQINTQDPRTAENKFLSKVTCNINYGKIYFRHIKDSDIDQGLKWLSENGQVNMMAMIHRHLGAFSRLLMPSHTKNLAQIIQIPLLVMPEDHTPIGW